MGRRRQYLDRVYTAVVFYACASQNAPIDAGTPAFVAPPPMPQLEEATGSLDVAPYATMVPTREVLAATLAALESLRRGDSRVPALSRFANDFLARLAPTHPWLGVMLEPPALAGRGVADVRRDPDLPPADG